MTLPEQIELACLLEATAPKLGNVHPGASFHDATYQDFVIAAHRVAAPLTDAAKVGVGKSIYEAVRATRDAVGTNVNLGIVLLLAPLAAIPADVPIHEGIRDVLTKTTVADSEWVYAAIRLAKPGGLGDSSSQDVQAAPTISLTEAMALAADRDMIAEQYATGFQYVINACQSGLSGGLEEAARQVISGPAAILEAICQLQRVILSQRVDTLIVRKRGLAMGEDVRQRYRDCEQDFRQSPLTSAEPLPPKIQALDQWLRMDGHARNPGATADLIAAALFVAIRNRMFVPPTREELADLAAKIETRS